jgi:nucleoside 2-deoxyribosyltransferase
MKDKKLQIFVSSTFMDLKEERQAAVEAILSSGHIPAGMELFSAGDESQMSVIKRWIDESDIYLLIFGGRYGSIDPISGKSYTHLEYEYALEKGKPLFAVVIDEKALEAKVKIHGTSVIEQENTKQLKEFKTIVLKNLVKFWEDKKDIKLAIHETISDFSYGKELIGWIRGDNSINTGALAEEIARLTRENADLREKLHSSNTSSTALYSNLTYDELAELLKRKNTKVNTFDYNLLELLLFAGISISKNEVVEGDLRKAIDSLVLYKIVRKISGNLTQAKFAFTEQGHNFYLKALSLQQKTRTKL